MNFNSDKFLKIITPFAILLAVAYCISTVIFFILPKKSINYIPIEKTSINYTNYDMSSLFTTPNSSSSKVKKSTKNIQSLVNLELLAVYSMNSGTGWITVKEKESEISTTLKTGENFKGYILKKVFVNYAIFQKNRKEYKLEIKQDMKKFEIITKQSNTSWKEKIILDGSSVQIKRKFLNEHVKDLEKAWKSVNAVPIRKNELMSGYLLTKVDKGSIIESLGLKQNDIIKRINDIKLNSYEQAFKIYKNIKNLKTLNIEIYRDNRLLELTYEIN